MGKFKPLLPYGKSPVIINLIEKLLRLSDKIIIVTGHKENEVEEVVKNNFTGLNLNDKLTFVFNPDFRRGMFTSLKKGIGAAKNCDWLLYHFVDQPHLHANFYNEFLNEIDDSYDWIQPSYKDTKGHPILMKHTIFDIMLNEKDDSSLRDAASGKVVKKKIWSCGFKEILEDIDTSADYERLTKQ
jgi:molybdenum cofactor cytidylyltransferase